MKIIEAKGSFYDIGAAVGEEMGDAILHVIDHVRDRLSRTAGGLDEGHDLAYQFLRHTLDYFPQACAYLAGVADGANTDLEAVTLASFIEEIQAWDGWRYAEKCSTIAVPTDRGWVVGHNEDFDRSNLGRMFVLDMRPNGYPRTVSLNYAAQLPCQAVLSERGFCITANSLPGPSRPRPAVTARLMKAALAETRGEALGVLSTGTFSLPYHFTLLGSDGGASSIETADDSYADAECSIQGLEDAYGHTNHPLRLAFQEMDSPSASSLERLRCIEKEIADCKGDFEAGNLLTLLMYRDPLYRWSHEVGPDDSVTLATVVIRPATGEFVVKPQGEGSEIHGITL